MQGKRIYPDSNGELWPIQPGEYGQLGKMWLACTPNGLLGDLTHHDVEEHEDGTITVNPSILTKDGVGKSWHGYLKRGVWSEC